MLLVLTALQNVQPHVGMLMVYYQSIYLLLELSTRYPCSHVFLFIDVNTAPMFYIFLHTSYYGGTQRSIKHFTVHLWAADIQGVCCCCPSLTMLQHLATGHACSWTSSIHCMISYISRLPWGPSNVSCSPMNCLHELQSYNGHRFHLYLHGHCAHKWNA